MQNVEMGFKQRILAKVRIREPAPLPKNDAMPRKYTNAIQNSALAHWCLPRGEIVSIPKLSPAEERTITYLVNKIARADPGTDISYVEEDLEWLICNLFGLTDEERLEVIFSLRDDLKPLTEEEEDKAMLRAIRQAEAWEQDDEFAKHEEMMRKLLGNDEC